MIRLLAFNYDYFRSYFYFRFRLSERKGESVPCFGDHVELSHEAIDFSSTVCGGKSGRYPVHALESRPSQGIQINDTWVRGKPVVSLEPNRDREGILRCNVEIF